MFKKSKELLINIPPLAIAVITLCYSLFLMAFYSYGHLNNNMDNFMLSAKMFGIPKDLQAHGIQPLYTGENQTGWDGQFYYSIANDPLGLRDTAEHIDSPAYRFQRVGFSALTKAVSLVWLQDWVSPKLYYFTYLALVVSAAWAAATFFIQFGASPAWALLWVFAVGTQLTLLNGLPDAAADAFFILGLLALIRDKWLFYSLSMSLCVLSREAYLLFPMALGFVQLMTTLCKEPLDLQAKLLKSLRSPTLWSAAFPVVIFIGWQGYVRWHFGVAPSEQAHGILGFPFKAWYNYLVSGLQGNHLLLGQTRGAYFEAASLLLFLALWLCMVGISGYALLSPPCVVNKNAYALGSLMMLTLYAFFGKTVILHYTGYMKAMAVFWFLMPALFCMSGKKIPKKCLTLLLLGLAWTNFHFLMDRLLPNPTEHLVRPIYPTRTDDVSCLSTYASKMQLISLEPSDLNNNFFSKILRRDTYLATVQIENTSSVPFFSTMGHGTVNAGFQYVLNGRVRAEGRLPLPVVLKPGDSVQVVFPVVVKNPFIHRATDEGRLVISLVQEGCAWFYVVNPLSSSVVTEVDAYVVKD